MCEFCNRTGANGRAVVAQPRKQSSNDKKKVSVANAADGVNELLARAKLVGLTAATPQPVRPKREFAKPEPYWATSTGASPDELKSLKAEAKKLQAIVDDPATGVIDRQRDEYRLTAVRIRIEQIEAALHPEKLSGKGATAGNEQLYAKPTPYWLKRTE